MALVETSMATDAGDTMNAAHKKFTNGKTTFNQDLNTIINAFDNVKLLGNRGMTISLGIDENGYIINHLFSSLKNCRSFPACPLFRYFFNLILNIILNIMRLYTILRDVIIYCIWGSLNGI